MSTNGHHKQGPHAVGALGEGYNSLYQSAMPTQLQNGNITQIAVSSQANIYVCTRAEQIFHALDINAGIAASTSWGSFQTRVDFVHSVQSTISSVTILTVAKKTEGGSHLTSTSFSNTPTSAIDLYRRGGDSYVSAVSFGGMYMAAHTFESYDETSYDSVVAAANTAFPTWGTEFNADFSAKIDGMKTSTGVNWIFKQHKIGFTAPTPSEADLVTFVLGFGQLTMDQQDVFQFSTKSYSTVDNCPTGFSTVDHYRSECHGNNDIDPSECLSNTVIRAQSNQKIIQGTKEFYDFYGCLGVEPKLDWVAKTLDDLLYAIAKWREDVHNSPTTAGIGTPVWKDDDLKVPVPQWVLDTSDGGPTNHGESYFADITVDMVPNLVRPISIAVKSEDSVDHIKTTYFIEKGDNHDYVREHGGAGGKDAGAMSFGPGDIITFVAPGWWDNDVNVKAIKIVTTSQPNGKIMGRNSPAPPAWGIWTNAPDTCLVGFAGFNDQYLLSLQAHLRACAITDNGRHGSWEIVYRESTQLKPDVPV